MDEFRRHGVDVSSEAMRYAFIGKISCFWHMPGRQTCPFGGKPIPLQPMVYRQSALWGEAGRSTDLVDRMMNMLFNNACPHIAIENDSNPADITDGFYLLIVPWFQINTRDIELFGREGERTTIALEGNSRIDQDWARKTYSLSVKGVEIARNGSTSCQIDDARIAFYAVGGPVVGASARRLGSAKDDRRGVVYRRARTVSGVRGGRPGQIRVASCGIGLNIESQL